MKEAQDSIVEFLCERDEVVTVDVTAHNTNFMVEHQPDEIKRSGNRFTIEINGAEKHIGLVFGFSATGGSYDVVLNGTADDDTFSRNISQIGNGPARRRYVFKVN